MMLYSRYDDTTLVQCLDCGWRGMVKDCIHDYKPVPPDDVEPVDYCPKCNRENLLPIDKDRDLVSV